MSNKTNQVSANQGVLLYSKQPGTNKIRWNVQVGGNPITGFHATKNECLKTIGYKGQLVSNGSHKEIGATGSAYVRPKYLIDLEKAAGLTGKQAAKLSAAEEAVIAAMTKVKKAVAANAIAGIVNKSVPSINATFGSLLRKGVVAKNTEGKFELA